MLTPAQLDQYCREGFVVISGAIARQTCEDLLAEIWCRLASIAVRRDDPATWELWPESPHGSGLLRFFPAFHLHGSWAIRQAPIVHEAFACLLGYRCLAVSIDRVNLKRPTWIGGRQRPAWRGRGFLHHDLNPWHPPRHHVAQGLVALTETRTAADGGFWCIPGFHHRMAAWAAEHRERQVPAEQVLVDFLPPEQCRDQLVSVPLAVGDLLIWNALLPHGSSPNDTASFRACQYVRMFAASELDEHDIAERIHGHRTGSPPRSFSTGARLAADGEARCRQRRYQPPLLTELGERLLGCRRWEPN